MVAMGMVEVGAAAVAVSSPASYRAPYRSSRSPTSREMRGAAMGKHESLRDCSICNRSAPTASRAHPVHTTVAAALALLDTISSTPSATKTTTIAKRPMNQAYTYRCTPEALRRFTSNDGDGAATAGVSKQLKSCVRLAEQQHSGHSCHSCRGRRHGGREGHAARSRGRGHGHGRARGGGGDESDNESDDEAAGEYDAEATASEDLSLDVDEAVDAASDAGDAEDDLALSALRSALQGV
eukprot:365340-Chlamydomonas_euryale.AAC.13